MEYDEEIENVESEYKLGEQNSGFMNTLRTGAAVALAGLFSIGAAAPTADAPAPEMEDETTTERYEGEVPMLGYNVEVRVTYEGEEDDEIHLPPNCQSIDVTLDQKAGLHDSDVVSYVEFTDFNCDRKFDRAHFRDTFDERRFNNDFSFRNKLLQDAKYSMEKIVTDGEWSDD